MNFICVLLLQYVLFPTILNLFKSNLSLTLLCQCLMPSFALFGLYHLVLALSQIHHLSQSLKVCLERDLICLDRFTLMSYSVSLFSYRTEYRHLPCVSSLLRLESWTNHHICTTCHHFDSSLYWYNARNEEFQYD